MSIAGDGSIILDSGTLRVAIRLIPPSELSIRQVTSAVAP